MREDIIERIKELLDIYKVDHNDFRNTRYGWIGVMSIDDVRHKSDEELIPLFELFIRRACK